MTARRKVHKRKGTPEGRCLVHLYGIGANCYELKLDDGGIAKYRKKVFNSCSKTFKYGFTTVSKIADTQKVSSYITKYITKEMITATKENTAIYVAESLILQMLKIS